MVSPRALVTAAHLSLLAVAAFLLAKIANTAIAASLRPHPTVPALAPVEVAPAINRPLGYYATITDKDIFNPPRPVEAGSQIQVAELKAKLLGTAPGDGMDSYAIIEDDLNKNQQLYRLGDKLQNRTLTKVAWDHVVLRNDTRDEILRMAEPANKPGAAVNPPPAEANAAIQQRDDNNFVIDRAEIDKSMQNLNDLFTQVRAVPHFQDGKAAGFRLFAIRQGSVFEKIGLKNGDIISRINGNELTDPARAMSLIQELRGEGRVAVELNRNRQPTTLNYEIR